MRFTARAVPQGVIPPRLILPASLSAVLTRPLKLDPWTVRLVRSYRTPGGPALSDRSLAASQKKAKTLLERRARQRAASRTKAEARKIGVWAERRTEAQTKIGDVLARRRLRAPGQVLSDVANLVTAHAPRREPDRTTTVIVRSDEPDARAFTRTLESSAGGAELIAAGATVRRLRDAGRGLAYYEVALPVDPRLMTREALNLSWALVQLGCGDAAWPGERPLFVFAGEPTHASHAERSFAWHVDLIRAREAHALPPGDPAGHARGRGAFVAHPDTGFPGTKAPHPEYNADQIDVARSHNVITGKTGGDNAAHSRRPEDAGLPNITHGSATGSLIVGGAPSDDAPDVSTLSEEELKFGELLGGRTYDEGGNPTVERGHIVGVAPEAKTVPIKFIKDAVVDWDASGAEGIGVVRFGDARFLDVLDYAASIDADVMSLSVGGDLSPAVATAFEDLIHDHDVIVVAAAGQTYQHNLLSFLSPDDSVIEPARFQSVIAVAGCAPDGLPWDESHRGPNVDITSPADGIWVAEFEKTKTDADGNRLPMLECASGTSFAAAITAGAAALWVAHWGGKARLKQVYPNVPLAWVFRELLQRTASAVNDAPWDAVNYGPGVLNAELLLQAALPPEDEIPEPPASVGTTLSTIGDIVDGGIVLGHEAWNWLTGQVQAGEETAENLGRAGIAVAAGIGQAIAKGAEDLLATTYAVIAEGGTIAAGALRDVEQFAGDAAAAAEDAATAAADAGQDVVDAAVDVVEQGADDLGEAAGAVANFFGL